WRVSWESPYASAIAGHDSGPGLAGSCPARRCRAPARPATSRYAVVPRPYVAVAGATGRGPAGHSASPSMATMLRAYGDTVVDPGDAWRRPRGTFGLATCGPGAHRTSKDDRAAFRFDRDAVGVDLRAPPERLLDLALDIRGRNPRLELDAVGDALDASQPAYRAFRCFALVVPLGLALERHPPVFDDHLDLFVGERQLVFQRRYRIARDVGVGTLVETGQ